MDTEEQIEKLRRESNAHEQALKEEVSHWVEGSKGLASKTLLIGGGLALAYLVARKFLVKNDTKKDTSKKDQPSTYVEVRNFILAEIAAFLLSIAKKRLLEYLKETKEEANVNIRDTERSESPG